MTGFKEWLLIAWVGTTTNFVPLEFHWNQSLCQRALETRRSENSLTPGVNLQCVQNFHEGRSQYPSRPGSGGIAGKK